MPRTTRSPRARSGARACRRRGLARARAPAGGPPRLRACTPAPAPRRQSRPAAPLPPAAPLHRHSHRFLPHARPRQRRPRPNVDSVQLADDSRRGWSGACPWNRPRLRGRVRLWHLAAPAQTHNIHCRLLPVARGLDHSLCIV